MTRVAACRIGLIATISWLCPGFASAGNDDGILLGSQAMLTGGAVTATVSDGSAAWYNPAGLANVERATFDINASTYGISINTANNLFTLPDGEQSSASFVDWQLIPSALAYTRRTKNGLVWSFGIFVPTTTDVDLRASITQADGRRWIFGTDDLRNEYDYILSIAAQASKTFRWGVALQGIYISDEISIQFGIGNPQTPGAPLISYSHYRKVGDYGLRIGAGLQWAPSAHWVIGLSVQTPTLTGFRQVVADEISGQAGNGQTSFESSHENDYHGVWELSTPFFLRMGAAYEHGKTQWSVDATVSSPIDSSESTYDRKLMGNARVGCLVRVSEALSVGTGLFTDLDSERASEVHFVGATLGSRFEKRFMLSDQRPLTFITSLGLRYAFGWGEVTSFDFSAIDQNVPKNAKASTRANELAINLGSGVSY